MNLITGGAGFIGSNFVNYLNSNGSNEDWVILDSLEYSASLDNISHALENKNFKFIKGNICDNTKLKSLFESYKFKNIIHFAAESHVDNSIINPSKFIDTNILGTFHLLENAKKVWLDDSFCIKKEFQQSKFIHISTDEVFGSLSEKDALFNEKSPYSPNSPYSASKASSDMIARSYFKTYNLPVIISNCSNNFGPYQHKEKLIPTIISNAIKEKTIPIYGKGKNIRDWLFVGDHCEAINKLYLNGKKGDTYTIGGNCEKTNLELTKCICEILDKKAPRANNKKYEELITFVKDRPGHDFRYGVDTSKIEKELNWKPKQTFEEALKKTINWYLQKK